MPETDLHAGGFPDFSQGGTHDKNENIPVFIILKQLADASRHLTRTLDPLNS